MIACRIQAHPRRRNLSHRLARELSAFEPEISEHSSDPPSPWAGYLQCLQNIPECDHLLVIQDDALPCPNFCRALEQVAHANPDTPVCLWLGPQPQGTATRARRAMQQGKRYVVFYPSPFVALVAVLWPRHKAEEFREWAQSGVKLQGHPRPRADDAIVAQWMKRTKQTIMVTVPSICEHQTVPSVKGTENFPTSWKAALLADDAAAYEW